MKIKKFIYGKFKYKYFLIRENRKSLRLIVRPNMSLIVRAPENANQKRIDIFLEKKWLWLEKQLEYFKKYQKTFYKREYISGESFLYLGRQYKLKVIKGKIDKVLVQKKLLIIETKKRILNGFHNKKILEKWYQQQSQKIFLKRYSKVIKNFNYEFTPKLEIKIMPKRWGSFLTNKKIVLNPELIKASTDCIDYVITHELCHMKYKNHSSKFYMHLKSKFPNWEKTKEKLELRMS